MTRGNPLGDGYLGRYRLDELLGSGGSAEVWRAHDTVADRTVALKMLAPVLTADPEYRRRFEREARAAALLHGPHVVPVHSYGELEGRLYIDSEFVDGLDIEALLEWEGPMAADAAVDLISQVASALDDAHAAGLIHRDVKPQNIIVAPDDVAYLIDFGTALQDGQSAITQTGMLVGTPAYMAPERFEGAASPSSDIYSLGCVLYECLTGQRPFRVRNPAQLMRAHLDLAPKPPSTLDETVPAALDAVVLRALAKNPGERYSTAGEFADAAKAALTAPAVPAEPGPEAQVTVVIPNPADTDARTTALPRPVPAVGIPAGMDVGTVALSKEADLGLPARRWTRRRLLAAAGFTAAATAIAIGAALFTSRAAELQPGQRARTSAVPTTKAPVQAALPPTTEPTTEPPEDPAAESVTPMPDDTLAPAEPPTIDAPAGPRLPGLEIPGPGLPGPGFTLPGFPGPAGSNRHGGRPHGQNSQ
ncbi:serine/threonine-protein kinase [Nocardia sp. NPDC059239]|uniref:serine/threonine-protein kinase n=1 Tax=unclassified Nocardia TaxID=2637762 RepID=UPI0036B97F24